MEGTAVSIEDGLKLIAALTAFLTVAIPTFYVTVGRPLLAQIRELIIALKDNTAATDTSAAALTTTATAVEANTVVTKAVAEALPTGPVTVNVATQPSETTAP